MKYVLLFGGTMEEAERVESPELAAQYARIEKWFDEQAGAGKVISAHELKGPETATTVRFDKGKPVVTDGPFIEAKEVIGGFAVVEVAYLDEALAMAKTWPGQTSVEVRPVVEH